MDARHWGKARDVRRRGSVLIWSIVAIPLLFVVGLLAVDAGRIYYAKSELQAAVDSAARYAASGLRDQGAAVASQRARTALSDNNFGQADSSVDFGLWDPGHKKLVVLSAGEANGATAVRVTARMNADEGKGVTSIFGSLLGMDQYSVTASATAAIGQPVNVKIEATASPYLAGLSSGDGLLFTGSTHLAWAPTHSWYDECKPVQVYVDLKPGAKLYFRDIEGSTGDYNSGLTYGLEGNLSRPDMDQAAAYGINTTVAPLNSLMGIFLDDRRPDEWAMQPRLDFSTSAAREKKTIDPLVKQVFFIGDGISNSNGRLQEFVVPDGATRLFLGLSDEDGFWWDNFGDYRTTLFTGDIQIVE